MSIPENVTTQLTSWITSAHAEQPILAISQSEDQLMELCTAAIEQAVPGKSASTGNHPDAITITAEKNTITVKQIRQLRSVLTTRPSSGKRIVCIPHAEQLLPESANMLLKTLEESGTTTRFLLGSPAKRSVLATIRSRCNLLVLGSEAFLATQPVDVRETLTRYSRVRISEEYSDEDLSAIARLVHSYTMQYGSNPTLARVALRLKDYYRTQKLPGGNIKLASDVLLASLAELRNTI